MSYQNLNNVGTTNKKKLNVNSVDRNDPLAVVKFNRITDTTTLTTGTNIGDTTITLSDTTGVAVGSYIILFEPSTSRFNFSTVTSVLSSPTFTIDTPLDYAFTTAAVVDIAKTDMSTSNGTLGSPDIYALRGTGVPSAGTPDVIAVLTRIIFNCEAATVVDLTKFGDIAGGLTNGLVLRRVDGDYANIFNIKTNGDLKGICYDWEVEVSTNPQQGIDGFTARLTFTRMGAAVCLEKGENLQFLVQDNLTTLTSLEVVAEGYSIIAT